MKRILMFAVAWVFCFVLQPVPSLAEHTRIWKQTDYASFSKGRAHGVALTNDGKLTPAPRLGAFADPNLAFVWTMVEDGLGNIYVGGGANAKVLKLNAQGAPTLVFESQELSAQALAIDKEGNLYVGTSPDGKVYRVNNEGKSRVFFDPKAKYIWSLLLAPDGTLYVSTGNAGEIFAVAPDGKAGLLYQSPQRHVRTMALDANGDLLIGTEPNGTIARIRIRHSEVGALPTAGPVSVLLETGAKEITSLFTAPGGVVYASAIGTSSESSAASLVMQSSKPMEAPPGNAGGSILYRILPDGSAEQMWSSHEDIVYAGQLAADGKILLGIGNRGLLLRVEDQNSFATIGGTNTGQVTGMIAQSDGKVLLSTANPGKIFRLASQAEGEGWFESIVFDAKAPARWGRISWSLDGEGKGENRVSLFVRCGNTSDPEDDWSPWQGPYQKGQTVQCPVSRFAQWRAVFSAGGHGAPLITGVSLAYLPKNIRPLVDEIVLQSPGVEIQGTSWASVDTKTASLRRPGGSQIPAIFASAPTPPPDNLQGTVHKGFQSVLWNAHDDNGDDMIFSIYCRREDEEQWTLLKSGITQRFYSWDTKDMPDGVYRLKIVASDEPSNPAADALQSERSSEAFKVDNTPPSITGFHIDSPASSFHLLFQARDSASIISRAEFSIDSGPWRIAFPEGLLSDASLENYDVALGLIVPGEHTFKVRVYDEFENIATAATQLEVSTGNRVSLAPWPSADDSSPHTKPEKPQHRAAR